MPYVNANTQALIKIATTPVPVDMSHRLDRAADWTNKWTSHGALIGAGLGGGYGLARGVDSIPKIFSKQKAMLQAAATPATGIKGAWQAAKIGTQAFGNTVPKALWSLTGKGILGSLIGAAGLAGAGMLAGKATSGFVS